MPTSKPSHELQQHGLQQEVGKIHPFEIPEQEAFLNLLRTTSVLSREFAALFKAHGISEPQFNAMRIIAGSGKSGIRMEEIGQRMVAHDPDTTRLIRRLIEQGFVEKEKLADDRRCSIARITPEGRSLLRKLRPKVEKLHKDQLGHLDRNQLKSLNALLVQARNPDNSVDH
ncbi:MAG: MarR family winged helix-turn-helix transcriptional regulator [Phycisphaerales bacterium]